MPNKSRSPPTAGPATPSASSHRLGECPRAKPPSTTSGVQVPASTARKPSTFLREFMNEFQQGRPPSGKCSENRRCLKSYLCLFFFRIVRQIIHLKDNAPPFSSRGILVCMITGGGYLKPSRSSRRHNRCSSDSETVFPRRSLSVPLVPCLSFLLPTRYSLLFYSPPWTATAVRGRRSPRR